MLIIGLISYCKIVAPTIAKTSHLFLINKSLLSLKINSKQIFKIFTQSCEDKVNASMRI